MTNQMFEEDPFGKVKSEPRRLEPPAREVNRFHTNSDRDVAPTSQHHTLGNERNQSSSGSHTHDGKNGRKISADAVLTITGSRAGNAALASLITELSKVINIQDSTTA